MPDFFTIDAYSYFFELPLYAKISIEDNIDNLDTLEDALNYEGTIDAYNPSLRENTTFQIKPDSRLSGYSKFESYNGFRTHSLICARTREIFKVISHFDCKKMVLQKIGQFPSIADMHISKVKQYDKVLSKPQLKEFTKAIGLAANGVGIGSFVYLRRIFEGLIEEAKQTAQRQSSWVEADYNGHRMDEKIELLKQYLPNFLFENRKIYGILSLGIHALSEEDCLAHFEIVKTGIELILDEKVEIFNKKKKEDMAKQNLAELTAKLSSNKK